MVVQESKTRYTADGFAVVDLVLVFTIEKIVKKKKDVDSGGIRTHAPEETGALNQRLRPLGHAILFQKRNSSNFGASPFFSLRKSVGGACAVFRRCHDD